MNTTIETLTHHLNPTDGHVIAGTRLDDNRFVGRMRAAQLFQIAPDPRVAEQQQRRGESTAEMAALQSVRAEVQRAFEGAKKQNVGPYSEYIVALRAGSIGITPPITLYCDTPLLFQENQDGTGLLQVPWDVKLIAIDGETQLAARHEAASKDPDTRHEFVPVYICFGHNQSWARQAFHDLNTLAVRPNTALSMSMDARDPVTSIANAVEQATPMLRGRVNRYRRQLRDTDRDITTITGLRGAVATLAKGIAGVKFGARPVPLGSVDVPAVEAAARDWFAAVMEAIGPAMEDRKGSIASSNAVLAAIGAVGAPLVSISDPAIRKTQAYRLASGLRTVHWDRGRRWDGIAGKMGSKGLTVAGTKGVAHAVYHALTEENSDEYSRVRSRA